MEVRTYTGRTEQEASAGADADLAVMTQHGWRPTGSEWRVEPGTQWGDLYHLTVRWEPGAVRDAATVKLEIADLQLRKKELAAAKRELNGHMAEIRSDYSSRVAQRGSKVRGGGNLGKYVRMAQTASRDGDRKATDQVLQPLVTQKEAIEAEILATDREILRLQHELRTVR